MNVKFPGGNQVAGLRFVRRPAAIACLLVLLAGIAAYLSEGISYHSPMCHSVLARKQQGLSESSISDLAAIRQETDPMLREERITELLDGTDMARIPSFLNSLQHEEDNPLTCALALRMVRRWADGNAADASAWVVSLPEGEWRTGALTQVAIAWSGKDYHQAADWARALEDETERENSLLKIAHETVRSEPIVALQIAADLPASGSNDELTRRAAMEWASTDPAGAAEWATQIEDATLREQVLSGVALAWGDTDPVAAATLAANELWPGRVQSDVVVGLVQRWAQRAPIQAAEWVESLPAGTLRVDAADNLLKQWSRTDPQAAREWAESRSQSFR